MKFNFLNNESHAVSIKSVNITDRKILKFRNVVGFQIISRDHEQINNK